MMSNVADDIFDEGDNGVDDDTAYQGAMAGSVEADTPAGGGEEEAAAAAAAEQAAEQAAQEQADKEAAAQQEATPPKGYVPHEALSEARHIQRELREELNRVQQQLGTFSGLREQLEELRAARRTEQQASEEEQFEADPVAYMKNRVDTLEGKMDDIEQNETLTKEQQQQLLEQQQAIANLQREIATQVSEYMQIKPDYQDAFKYLMEARVAEYKALGITDVGQQNQMFDREAMALAQVALHNKRNPGEAAYELAKARGYKPAAPTSKEGEDGKPAGDTLEQQLDKLEKGQKAAKTLSGGGHAVKTDLTLDDIDSLSDTEFDALFSDMAAAEHGGSFLDE